MPALNSFAAPEPGVGSPLESQVIRMVLLDEDVRGHPKLFQTTPKSSPPYA
jgi:hypothetical protein